MGETSRREPEIEEILGRDPALCTPEHMDQLEDTSEDIRHYVKSKVRASRSPISGADVEKLVDQAGGLFIWCTTLFKFLGAPGTDYFGEELTYFLQDGSHTAPLASLYGLYDHILRLAARNDQWTRRLRLFLGVIFVTASNRPLSAKTIAKFMADPSFGNEHTPGPSVRDMVEALHAVLYEDAKSLEFGDLAILCKLPDTYII